MLSLHQATPNAADRYRPWGRSILGRAALSNDAADPLDQLFDFRPSFDDAVAWVRSPNSQTRLALHELVSTISIRLYLERTMLFPLLEGRAGEIGYEGQSGSPNRRIERLLLAIDRRDATSSDLGAIFGRLENAVHANLDRQKAPCARYRALLSAEDLTGLRVDLERAGNTKVTRPHPHLPHNGPMGATASALAARVDHIRDQRLIR